MELTFVITDVLAARSPLLQNVRVSWMETQVPQPIEVIVSGNPGYVTGFPLLVSGQSDLFAGSTRARFRLTRTHHSPTAVVPCAVASQPPMAVGASRSISEATTPSRRQWALKSTSPGAIISHPLTGGRPCEHCRRDDGRHQAGRQPVC